MTRLIVEVEGQTEESVVNNVLAHHLYSLGFSSVSARILGNARLRSRRGGIVSWQSARHDVLDHLKQDSARIVTTMVDYYALPESGAAAWPGRLDAKSAPFAEKASTVQEALADDIATEMGTGFDRRRFVPFVMMHEFEALLFSDCSMFAEAIGQPSLASKFQAVRDEFESPEEINDSPLTAPSKRIEAIWPEYQKPLMGTIAMLALGIERVRQECPHFDSWVARLEACAIP